MTVEIVFTERRADLTEVRARNFERLEEELGTASGQVVDAMHYEEVEAERLALASAVVLSGSSTPWAARDAGQLERLGEAVRACGRPVLGICAGMQLQALFAGGAIGPSPMPEHGYLPLEIADGSDLFRELPRSAVVFQDHDDEVVTLPEGFHVLAWSAACSIQAVAHPERRWWGTQFHPEEWSTEHPAGEAVLRAFFSLAR